MKMTEGVSDPLTSNRKTSEVEITQCDEGLQIINLLW